MRVQPTRRYLIAFVALILLCGLGHEFAHHVVGALFCGAVGDKTFNSFTLASDCANRPLAFVLSTWAGPLFTFALMWIGWRRLRSPDAGTRQLGLALIFANFPLNRLLFALLGGNDEQYVTRVVIGDSMLAFWLTNLAIWVMVLPPLAAAWRALDRHHRLRSYATLLVLPLLFVMLFGVTVEDVLLLQYGVLAERVWGIPWLLIVTEVAALVTWYMYRGAIPGMPGHACRGPEARLGQPWPAGKDA
jgi:hypothetical protein